MRQITDPRAPFKTVDDAIAAGHEHCRQLGSPMAFVAEPQPGGFFVRVAYSTPSQRGGRSARHRGESHTVEIGKIDGPAFWPIDNSLLSGKPYLCDKCGGVWGNEDCTSLFCEIEDGAIAQARLVEAHAEADDNLTHEAKRAARTGAFR